jgi:hypothetical protein
VYGVSEELFVLPLTVTVVVIGVFGILKPIATDIYGFTSEKKLEAKAEWEVITNAKAKNEAVFFILFIIK